MLDLQQVFNQIYKGVSEPLSNHAFKAVYPTGVKQSETPMNWRGEDGLFLDFISEKARLRILYSGSKVFLLTAAPDAYTEDDSEFNLLSTNLLELDTYNDKDVKFIISELVDTIEDNFGKKQLAARQNKTPVPVSKSAAKSGALSYDPNTLANRLAANYPELKEPYKENITMYGEFLAEDFFVNHANNIILSIIRENNSQKVKKLFNILNEIYEDGTNEVQSLIIVTILGSMKNDPELIKVTLEYMNDDMMEPVINVNQILAKSKSANMRLENPPKYKPKKKKSGGILSSLGLG